MHAVRHGEGWLPCGNTAAGPLTPHGKHTVSEKLTHGEEHNFGMLGRNIAVGCGNGSFFIFLFVYMEWRCLGFVVMVVKQ